MDKTRINLDVLLPEVPDERDGCVKRLIASLQPMKGISRVHIVPKKGDTKASLCFHYDPSITSIAKIETIARETGVEITGEYGHLLIQVSGVRHQRHANILEAQIRDLAGIVTVSVSGTGFIQVEYKKTQTAEKGIIAAIRDIGLVIKNVEGPKPGAGKSTPIVNKHPGFAHNHEGHNHKHSNTGHDHAGHDHSHAHGGIFGERTELIFSIISGMLLGIGFGLSFVKGISYFIPLTFYCGSYLFGGFYTTKEAIEGLLKKEFEIDFLMLVAAVGAALLNQWAEGALLLFLFSLGHSLEHYAMEKARKSIAALAEIAPKTALVKVGSELKEVAIGELKPGDVIVVKPNSKISADGLVINGTSSVNQAPITGESVPVDKVPVKDRNMRIEHADKVDASSRVFAGSVNGGGSLEVKVTKTATDSTIARLVKLVNEAQTQKSATQNFTSKLEKYYVPAVLVLVGLLLLAFLVKDETFSQSFYRAMAVLVAASPCALAIATPSAVLSGVARAARGGVLIKGGRPLEELGSLTAIAFDKTGTLTEGKPKLTGVYPLNGTTEQELLTMVTAAEQLSDHPLAAAIVKGALAKLKNEVPAATDVEAITGRGIKATYNGTTVYIGNKELFIEKNMNFPDDIRKQAHELENHGNTTMLVHQNDRYVGIITLMDVARTDARETLSRLHHIGITKMIMLTGDNQQVAESIAREIGITDAWGNLLPEDKVEAIEKLKRTDKKVAMVGDGINDAPAMARSTVGIAMGAAGSDVALETADIALMADKLGNLPFAIGLSKKAHHIIRQNLVISLGMVVILVPLTILGIAHIGPAVIGHEGSTILVVFNALRLLAYKV